MDMLHVLRRSSAVTVVLLFATALSACGSSQPAYTFQTDTKEVHLDKDSSIDVRLIHGPSGKQIVDAVIFATRFDMAPDAMAAMTAPVVAQASPAAGVYRFAVKPTMAGRWQLTLGAKVQGETETVTGSVVVTAR